MPAPNENYGSSGSDSSQFGEGWHPLLLELRFVPIGIGDNDLPGGHTSHMLGDRRQQIGQRPGLGEIDTRPASFIVHMGLREAGRDKAALQVDDLRHRADMRPYRFNGSDSHEAVALHSQRRDTRIASSPSLHFSY